MSMSREDMMSLYNHLYNENCEGVEEDYMEEYEANYLPENVFLDGMTGKQLLDALSSLVSELVDDTGDVDLVREWAEEGGADEEMLALLDLA